MSLETILRDISSRGVSKIDAVRSINSYLASRNSLEGNLADSEKCRCEYELPFQGINKREVCGSRLQDTLQKNILTLCKNYLRLSDSQFHVDTLFSSVGFDSISVSAVMADINKKYRLNMPVPVFLEYNTVRSFCEYLELIHSDKILRVLGIDHVGKNELSSSLNSQGNLEVEPLSTTLSTTLRRSVPDVSKTHSNTEGLFSGRNNECNDGIESNKNYESKENNEICEKIDINAGNIKSMWEQAEKTLDSGAVEETPPEKEQAKGFGSGDESIKNPLKDIPNSFSVVVRDVFDDRSEFIISGSGEKTILLISGLNVLASSWYYQVRALAPRYRVLCYHPPGYGATNIIDTHTSFNHIAKSLKSAINMLGVDEPMTVIGWSMGGSIAQEYAIVNPEKVESLVLINTSPSAVTSNAPFSSLLEDIDSHQHSDEIKKLLAWDKAFNPTALNYYKSLFKNWNLVDELQDIDCPVRVISGRNDQYVLPHVSQRIAEKCPNGSFHMLDQAGHFIPLTNSEALNKFLSSAISDPTNLKSRFGLDKRADSYIEI